MLDGSPLPAGLPQNGVRGVANGWETYETVDAKSCIYAKSRRHDYTYHHMAW